MLPSSSNFPSCGLIQNPENGPEIVLADRGNSEIFSLDSLTWREGPEAPYFYEASSAQLQDTFLVVGGTDEDGNHLDTIYEFDHVTYDWLLRSQRLPAPLRFPGVVAVPGNTVSC